MRRKFHLTYPKHKRILRIALRITACLTVAALIFMIVCNIVVIAQGDKYLLPIDEAKKLENVDCIIVLGAGIRDDGSLSGVLEERVKAGAELYLNGASERILVSGDHSREDYNEVGAMKDYMISRGISADVVFTDHAGFDTYDTMYRAKEVFQAEKVIIVTQDFHISRAVFIARSLGLEAYGVASDEGNRYTNIKNEIREFCARPKYTLDAIFKPEPTYLGEAIPIWGEASASDG